MGQTKLQGKDEGTKGVLDKADNLGPGMVTIKTCSGPTWGSVDWEKKGKKYTGKFTYTPGQNFPGGDSFTFQIFVGKMPSDKATVTIGKKMKGYTFYIDIPKGNPLDENKAISQGGYQLEGGGTDQDKAFTWLVDHAHKKDEKKIGGDIVVLRASQGGALGPYMRLLAKKAKLPLNSVRTYVFDRTPVGKAAANSAAVVKGVNQAEAIFLAGGNQYYYKD
jgi:hypothetical protein